MHKSQFFRLTLMLKLYPVPVPIAIGTNRQIILYILELAYLLFQKIE